MTFSAGIAPTPASPAGVDALLKLLTATAAAPAIKAKGLDPA